MPNEKQNLPDTGVANESADAMGQFSTIDYLTPETVTFVAVEGFAGMRQGEAWYPRVLFYRAFPFTHPDRLISVRDIDANELGMIDQLADFPADTQALILEQIELRYYAPRITAITKAKEEFGFIYWEVSTTSGPCRFTTRNSSGNIVMVSEHRLVIVDIDGNRFEIPDVRELDPKDYKKMELYV